MCESIITSFLFFQPFSPFSLSLFVFHLWLLRGWIRLAVVRVLLKWPKNKRTVLRGTCLFPSMPRHSCVNLTDQEDDVIFSTDRFVKGGSLVFSFSFMLRKKNNNDKKNWGKKLPKGPTVVFFLEGGGGGGGVWPLIPAGPANVWHVTSCVSCPPPVCPTFPTELSCYSGFRDTWKCDFRNRVKMNPIPFDLRPRIYFKQFNRYFLQDMYNRFKSYANVIH